MNTVTVNYREWVITAQARVADDKGKPVLYEATAVLEKFIHATDKELASKERNLRRTYGVSAPFETEAIAKSAAIAAAKCAIDMLY